MGDPGPSHLRGPLVLSLGDCVPECHGPLWFEWKFLEGTLLAGTPPSRGPFQDEAPAGLAAAFILLGGALGWHQDDEKSPRSWRLM